MNDKTVVSKDDQDRPECGRPMTVQFSDKSGYGPTVTVCVPYTNKRVNDAFPGLLR